MHVGAAAQALLPRCATPAPLSYASSGATPRGRAAPRTNSVSSAGRGPQNARLVPASRAVGRTAHIGCSLPTHPEPNHLLKPRLVPDAACAPRNQQVSRRMKLRTRGACPALASTVAFAFCDLAGAGPRALMALEPPAGCSMSAAELDVEGLPAVSRAFATQHGRSAPLELITFADGSGKPHASLLLLLAPVPEEHQTAVAAAVFDFLKQSAGARCCVARAHAARAEPRRASGPTSRLVVAAAMRFPASQAEPTVRAVAFNGAPDAGLPGLPPDTTVSDGMLASLLHFCRAGGLPTLALLAPGFRVRLPGSAVDDEAVAVRSKACQAVSRADDARRRWRAASLRARARCSAAPSRLTLRSCARSSWRGTARLTQKPA